MKFFRKALFVMLPAIVVGAGFPCPVHGQSARETVMVLKKLKTRCETGVSYSDYPKALADAKNAWRNNLDQCRLY